MARGEGGGRPSKLTPETQKRIIDALQVGATYEMAANYAGIWYTTLNSWLKQGKEAKSGKHKEFYDAVQMANGRAAVGWLVKIEAAANVDWRAAAWKLERRYHQDFGRQDRIEHTGQFDHEVTDVTGALEKAYTDDEFRDLALPLLRKLRE